MPLNDLQLPSAAGGGSVPRSLTNIIDLSIVVPAHNEAATLRPLWQETADALAGSPLNWELLVIDDGSSDGTAAILDELHQAHPRFGAVSLRRQCGKSAALALGFHVARGRLVIMMDGDLQDDPREIPRLVAALSESDVVNGWKVTRRDPLARRLASRVFNFAARGLFGLKLHDLNCGLKGFRRAVLDELPLHGELHRFLPLLAMWRGFTVTELAVNHRPRPVGRSRYGPMRPFFGLMDLATVLFLTRFRRRPAHLFGLAGVALLVPGVLIAVYIATLWLQYGNIQRHHPLLIGGVLLIVVGVQLLTAGIFGELLVTLAAPAERDYPVRFRLAPRS